MGVPSWDLVHTRASFATLSTTTTVQSARACSRVSEPCILECAVEHASSCTLKHAEPCVLEYAENRSTIYLPQPSPVPLLCVARSWGFMCPVHTPDGAPCGLLNHLARACLVTTDIAPKRTSAPPTSTSSPLFSPPPNAAPKSRDAIGRAVLQSLAPFGVRQLALGLPLGPPPDYLTIILDGLVRGGWDWMVGDEMVNA